VARLAFPSPILTKITIPVRITDINYGNHVGNDAYVSIMHEARVQWLAGIGLKELNVGEAGLIMAALSIDYLAESFYGDILQIEMAVGELSQVRFELFYRISTIRDDKQIEIAIGKTTMVCYDYQRSKATATPESLVQILTAK
jgi:acyl-CoA thioester hydrolase